MTVVEGMNKEVNPFLAEPNLVWHQHAGVRVAGSAELRVWLLSRGGKEERRVFERLQRRELWPFRGS